MSRSSVDLNKYDEDDDEVVNVRPLKPGKENNQSANERFKNACDTAGLSKGQREMLHKRLGNTEYTYDEILEEALSIKDMYPNK